MTVKTEVDTLDDSGMKALCSGRDATNQEEGRASQKALPVHRKEPVQAAGAHSPGGTGTAVSPWAEATHRTWQKRCSQ